MRKRSRLRSERGGKGRLWVILVLAGLTLFLGLYLFLAANNIHPLSLLRESSAPLDSLLDTRGTIFDRNYKELAVTLDRVSVYADVREVNAGKVAEKLSGILGAEEEELRDLMEREHYRAWLAKNITLEEEEKITSLDLNGVHLKKERARFYPEGKTAAHVIGFVGKSMGLSGVEYRYNSLLNRYGPVLVQSGAEIVDEIAADTEEGHYLVLTLDLKIQRILEKFVRKLGGNHKGSRISALLLDCDSSGIVGSAVHPSFDPNRFGDYVKEDMENLLSEQILIPEQLRKILWDGSLLQSAYESNDETLPWSVHAGERNLGSQLRLWERLGLNDRISLDFLKDEAGGVDTEELQHRVLKSTQYDSIPDNTTPLHLLTAMYALISGEEYGMPHAIDKISGKDRKVYRLQPRHAESAVGEEVAVEFRKQLYSVMKKGPVSSGVLEVDFLSYKNRDRGREYTRNTMLLSVIPHEKTKLMLFVFAKLPPFSPSPAKTKSRFEIAGPAQEIILPMVAMQEVMSSLSELMTVEEKKKVNFELHREIGSDVIGSGFQKVESLGTMPDLKGLSLRKSLRMLKDLKLEIQINGSGVVVEQTPRAGKQVKPGELCRLVLKPH